MPVEVLKVKDSEATVFEFLLEKELNDVTPTADLTKGQTVVTFNAGHSFVVGDFWTFYWDSDIALREEVNQLEVVAVATNDITLGTPIGEAIPVSKIRQSKRVTTDLSIDGSVTTEVFGFSAPQGLTWHVTRLISTMLLASQPDDGKFGDIAKLTRGCYFGIDTPVISQLLGGFRENGDFRRTAYDLEYTTRTVPASTYGLAFRKSFNGADKYGAVLPIDSSIGARFVCGVQDNLSTISQFRIAIMGKQKT